jgi:putative spermidine/putrescine transport system permease protein
MKKAWMLVVSACLVLPLLVMALYSLFLRYPYPDLLPAGFTLSYWRRMVGENTLFWPSLVTSTIIGFLNGALSCIVGMMTARAITRRDRASKRLLILLTSLPLFIPAIALFLGVHLVMLRLRLVNTGIGIILAHMLVTVPYTTNVFISYFLGIQRDMERAAHVLGASPFVTFRRILLPLLKPGIWLAFSIGFLISFSEYFSTFLIGGGHIRTLSSLFYPYVGNADSGNGSVLGLVFVALNLAVFVLADTLAKRNKVVQTYLYDID